MLFDRECVTDHEFGNDCSPASFGHSGWSGTSFGFADPDRKLAVGVILNGIAQSKRAFEVRAAVVEAIYADLDV
jgi:hypothetical protein